MNGLTWKIIRFILNYFGVLKAIALAFCRGDRFLRNFKRFFAADLFTRIHFFISLNTTDWIFLFFWQRLFKILVFLVSLGDWWPWDRFFLIFFLNNLFLWSTKFLFPSCWDLWASPRKWSLALFILYLLGTFLQVLVGVCLWVLRFIFFALRSLCNFETSIGWVVGSLQNIVEHLFRGERRHRNIEIMLILFR